MKLDEYLKLELDLYKVQPFKKKFVPIEKIAKDPQRYGYNVEQFDSKAKQEEFLKSTSKITAAVAANRAGKTNIGAIKALKICQNNIGRFWILTPSYDAQKGGAQEKILEYLKPEKIVHTAYAGSGIIRNITLNNGTIIEFKSYDQGREKLQSAKLIGAWFDEEPPEDIYREVYTRTVDLSAQIIMTFTPLKGFTWSYKEIFNSTDKSVSVFSWGMADNPFIPRNEIETMKGVLSFKQAQMRLYGKYMGSESAVWGVFNRDTHINKVSMYNPDLPVDITIDFGVVVSAALFGQYQKIPVNGKMIDRFVILDAMEMYDTGYSTMMRLILQRISQNGWSIGEWYGDCAGNQRQQGSKTGSSLMALIKEEFGVTINYLKKIGIEESIEIVASYMMNAKGEPRFFLDHDIRISERATLAERIENYIRDDVTRKPIDDDVVTHCCDILRYYTMNKIRGDLRGGFEQR